MQSVSPKNLMLCGMVGQLVCGIYLAFVNDFWLQSLARLLCSISCAQMYTAGTAICKRFIFIICFQLFKLVDRLNAGAGPNGDWPMTWLLDLIPTIPSVDSIQFRFLYRVGKWFL